jgi:hypothetical protein
MELPIWTVLDQERVALDPGALETNRAGTISKGQRAKLRARATGALIGFFATSVLVPIAWWVAMTGPKIWIVAALIATVAAPVSLWALDRIRADLRSGRVIRVTGQPIVGLEDEENRKVRVVLRGRRFSLPSSAASILRQPGEVTAYFTPWSGMLVNVAPAAAEK